MNKYLMHHGVKGQKWGVRRYQNRDGSLTSLGRSRRVYSKQTGTKKILALVAMKYYEVQIAQIDKNKNTLGNSVVDTYIKSDIPLYRIQSNSQYESEYAFYATHLKKDTDKYAGLFGKNLKSRAEYVARKAEKEAKATGNDTDAIEKRKIADNMEVYQLKLTTTNKLKVPSERSASNIVSKLLKDDDFKSNLYDSFKDTSSKMFRPAQKLLLTDAMKKLRSDKIGDNDAKTIYRALNLTLTNHNDQEVSVQKKFYSALKDNGYSALLDVNDKFYSSYHAKSPVIVFDTSKVKFASATRMNPKTIDKLYRKHNTRRVFREIPEQVFGNISKYAGVRMDDAKGVIDKRLEEYLKSS